jgi:hypothetical protein
MPMAFVARRKPVDASERRGHAERFEAIEPHRT